MASSYILWIFSFNPFSLAFKLVIFWLAEAICDSRSCLKVSRLLIFSLA